jgi:hypothetical protein
VQPPRQRSERHRGEQDAGQGGVHAQRAGQAVADAGRPRRRRVAGVLAQAGQDAGQLGHGDVRPAAGGEQRGELAGQPHQPADHHDNGDGDEEQGVVGLVVLELGAGKALALGPLRPHHSLLPHRNLVGASKRRAVADGSRALLPFCSCSANRNEWAGLIRSR